jgi:hypothetical protein
MIFWSLCAFIWVRNMKKMLLQMTSVSLQPVPSLAISAINIKPIELVIGEGQLCWLGHIGT